jgi:predicted Zn-ribbon and HTH transcriptional regulator
MAPLYTSQSVQVLRYVAGDARKEVFSILKQDGSLAAALSAALTLPQDLLASWITSEAPELDLREACDLSTMQWARLSACILQADPSAITTLHIPALGTNEVSQDELNVLHAKLKVLRERSKGISSNLTRCNMCGCRFDNKPPSHVLVGSRCPNDSLFCATPDAPILPLAACYDDSSLSACKDQVISFMADLPDTSTNHRSICPNYNCPSDNGIKTELISLSVGFPCGRSSCSGVCPCVNGPSESIRVRSKGPLTSASGEEYCHMLSILGGVAVHLTKLQHLGLHDIAVTPWLVRSLGQVFIHLPDRVTQLTIAISSSQLIPDGGITQMMFFKAVALLRGLRELHMPDWEEFVGSAPSCSAPLRALPGLVIHVREVKHTAAFPRTLKFHAA